MMHGHTYIKFSVKLMQKIKNINSEDYHSLLLVLILTSFRMCTVIIITHDNTQKPP